MITEKNHKLLTSQLFVTDCTKKGLASMDHHQVLDFSVYRNVNCSYMRLACFVIGDSKDSKVCTACDKLIVVFQILRNISVSAIMLDTNGTWHAVFYVVKL